MNEQDCEQLTLFQADSLVSHFPLPGNSEAQKMTVTSGRKCCALLKNSNPLGLLLKTCLTSSIWHSTRCFLLWKARATKQGRYLFQLAVSVPGTSESGSPFLATPAAADSVGAHGGGMGRSLRTDCGGQPNPEYVEWMMGYQMAFTGLIPTLVATSSRGAVSKRWVGGGVLQTQPPRIGRGFPGRNYWEIEPDVGRVAHGVPNRMDRVKCLGNAVVPQQFYPIFKAIYLIEEQKHGS